MKPLLSLIGLTVRTTLNRRLLWSVIALGLVSGTVILLFANMSLEQNSRLVVDFGLAATILIAIIVSIVVTANMVLAEQDRGTLLIVLPKPIARSTFLVAKYLGLLISALVIYLILGATIFGLAATTYHQLPWADIMLTFIAAGLEIVALLALATLTSAFTTPILSTLLTFGFFVAGHSLSLILYATTQSGVVITWLGKAIYYLLPNLEKFNVRELYLTASQMPASYYGYMTLYAILYSTVALILGVMVINKREW